MIGRLFGRKPNDDEAARSADRLITSRDAKPAAAPDVRANDARIDAALDAAVDTVALSPIAQALPSAPAVSAAPLAGGAPQHEHRTGPRDPWLADAFDLLLAEEQGEAPAALYGGGYGLSEADLERIAARVADRLTRGGLGDTVARIVTEVSERLVREEIERIRQSASTPDDRP